MELGRLAQRASHFVTVHAGQADVQEHEVGIKGAGGAQGGMPVIGDADFMAVRAQ